MGCGCNNSRDIRNWNSLLQSFPVDPLSVISYAELSVAGPSQVGQWALSSTYREPTVPSTWLPTPVSVNGEVTVISNGADQMQQQFDAQSWNFRNQTSNTSTTTPPPLRNTIFVRAGVEWTNIIPLTVQGSPHAVVDIELSMLDNAATRGDMQETIPVIRWTGDTYTGLVLLRLVLYSSGRYSFGIRTIDNNTSPGPPGWGMFALDVVGV